MQATREFSDVTIHPICPRTNLTFAETELLRCSALWQRIMELSSDAINARCSTAPEYTADCMAWWRDAKHRADTFELAAAKECWAQVSRQLDMFDSLDSAALVTAR